MPSRADWDCDDIVLLFEDAHTRSEHATSPDSNSFSIPDDLDVVCLEALRRQSSDVGANLS